MTFFSSPTIKSQRKTINKMKLFNNCYPNKNEDVLTKYYVFRLNNEKRVRKQLNT